MGNVHMEATQINYRGGDKKMSVEEAIKAGSSYELPIASDATLGGVKIGSGISIAEGGAISADAQLPADPETDGVKVLTATTTSGETVKTWEDPSNGVADFSTTEQATGRKWLNSPTYQIVIDMEEEKTVQSNTWYTVGDHLGASVIINGMGISGSGGIIPLQIVEDITDGIKILQTRNVQVGVRFVWLEYTKTVV